MLLQAEKKSIFNADTLLFTVVILIGLGIVLIFLSQDRHENTDGSICLYGFKYDRNAHQILNTVGGGIPCQADNTKK